MLVLLFHAATQETTAVPPGKTPKNTGERGDRIITLKMSNECLALIAY